MRKLLVGHTLGGRLFGEVFRSEKPLKGVRTNQTRRGDGPFEYVGGIGDRQIE